MIIQRGKKTRLKIVFRSKTALNQKRNGFFKKSLRKISVTFFSIFKDSIIVSNKKVDVKSKKVFFSAAIRHHNILALTGGVRRKSQERSHFAIQIENLSMIVVGLRRRTTTKVRSEPLTHTFFYFTSSLLPTSRMIVIL